MAFQLFSYPCDAQGEQGVRQQRRCAYFTALYLNSRSKLFGIPANGFCADTKSFVAALNTLVAAQSPNVTLAHLPHKICDSVSTGGNIHWSAELLHFGLWLLVDGQPGFKNRAGHQADLEIVLRCVAVASIELFRREAHAGLVRSGIAAIFPVDRRSLKKSTSNKITRTDMSHRWEIVFLEPANPSQFKSRLVTSRYYLNEYLKFLKNRSNEFGVLERRQSKHLKSVCRALTSEANKTKKAAR